MAQRGDKLVNADGVIAEITVPLLVGEDDSPDDLATFGWGAFLLVGEERIARLCELPLHDDTFADEEDAANYAVRKLTALGFRPIT